LPARTYEGKRVLKAGTNLAVLGLVIQRPSYGYELNTRFKRVFGLPAWEWVVSSSAIYNALDDLQHRKLIEPFTPEVSTSRQPKTHYRATATGAREMRKFLETPLPADPSQADFLIRINLGLEFSRDGLISMLEDYAHTCLGTLHELGLSAEADALYERLAHKQRELIVQAQLSWIDYALSEIRAAS
jgi:DNA-binding PadR family transcriptional regulator